MNTRPILLATILLTVARFVGADEPVVLRTPRGLFLRTAEDRTLRADRWLPGERETFHLLPLPDTAFAVQAFDGRLLWAEGPDARRLRADSPRADPGERETFVATAVAPGQAGWKPRGYREFIVFDPESLKPSPPTPPGKPRPGETVEVFRLTQVPPPMLATLSTALASLVTAELADKPYQTSQTRKHEQFIDVPAPTLKNLRQTRRVQVLATEEQYQLTAQLNGPPETQFTHLSLLKTAERPGLSVMLFALDARFPVRGRVQYRVPKVVDASTAYRTTVKIRLIGELQWEKSGDTLTLRPAAVRDVRIELGQIEISNDVLQVFHRQIRELINHEIGKNQPRIESQANEALTKAVGPAHLQSDFLQFIDLP